MAINDFPHSIVAAGGILIGRGSNQGKISLVRRSRYGGEVALPKGKLRAGEEPVAAARREVREETGYEVKLWQFAGTTRYFVGAIPKIVFYYVMEEDGGTNNIDAAEIAAVEWTTPEQSLGILTHREDRHLVAAVFGIRNADRP